MPQDSIFIYDVFLSFSVQDTEKASDIWKKLTNHQLNVFWSDAILKKEAGESWFDKIEESLEHSQHMVVLISEKSLKSEWVLREYKAFLNSCYKENVRRLIPLLDTGIEISNLPLFMREFQSFRLDDKNAIEQIGEMLWENSLRRKTDALEEEKQHDNVHGEFVDPRDNCRYHTVKIGEQVWFADNLNFQSPESKIFSKNKNYTNNYGRLYHWLDAQNACPPGYRIPDNDDWDELITTIGGPVAACAIMINGNFSARFGGMALRDSFDYFGQHAYFWSANNFDDLRAFCYTLFKSEMKIQRDVRRKELFYSVRCLRED